MKKRINSKDLSPSPSPLPTFKVKHANPSKFINRPLERISDDSIPLSVKWK
jgi:hypothetical protein